MLFFLRVVLSPSWQPVRGPVTLLEWCWSLRWCSWTQSQPLRSRYHFMSPHWLHCFSLVLHSFLIGLRYSAKYSVNRGVGRLTPLSPAEGDDYNTDLLFFVCVKNQCKHHLSSISWLLLIHRYKCVQFPRPNTEGAAVKICMGGKRTCFSNYYLPVLTKRNVFFGSCSDINKQKHTKCKQVN